MSARVRRPFVTAPPSSPPLRRACGRPPRRSAPPIAPGSAPSDAQVAELIDEVTSPGGTTTRALQGLKNGRFSAVLTDAMGAAWERGRELGDQLEASLTAPQDAPR